MISDRIGEHFMIALKYSKDAKSPKDASKIVATPPPFLSV